MADEHQEDSSTGPPEDHQDVTLHLGSEQSPSYGATDANVEADAPPSYQSLYGKMKDAKEQSNSPVGFVSSVVCLLLNTVFMTIFMAILLAIPITMIVIGAMYKDDCPVQYLIPIYLITTGVVYIVKAPIDLNVRRRRSQLSPEEQEEFKPGRVENAISNVLGLFLFVFFICGNVWIYRIYAPTDAECNPVLYYFAF